MSVVHEHCSYVIMELQIQSLAYLFWDKKQIYFRIAIFFNIIETMQMALGSIGDVLKRSSCSGTAIITDGDWIVSRNAHSHPDDISSFRAKNLRRGYRTRT